MSGQIGQPAACMMENKGVSEGGSRLRRAIMADGATGSRAPSPGWRCGCMRISTDSVDKLVGKLRAAVLQWRQHGLADNLPQF
jgi:hypothetical protein